jgi:hypothetical protein
MYIMLTVDCYNLEIRGSTMRSNKPVKIIECGYATFPNLPQMDFIPYECNVMTF